MTQFRPSRFDMIPPVIKNLLIVNVLFFFAQYVFKSSESFNMNNLFALHDIRSNYFKPHQLITHMFMHDIRGFGHLFFNMLALWMFGAILENNWGAKRFLIFYMVCGLGAGLIYLGVQYVELTPVWESLPRYSFEDQQLLLNSPRSPLNSIAIGASGAVFGVLAAFAYLFPNMPIYLYFLIPVKAKWLMLFYAGIELWMVVQSGGGALASWAHLGGALVGILMVMFWNRTNRRTFY